MIIKVMPYKEELIEDFVYDGIEVSLATSHIKPMVKFYGKLGSIFVGMVNSRVIGLGGVYPLWDSSGGCFLFLNKEAEKYKKEVFINIQHYINKLVNYYNIKILTVECLNNLKAESLIRHLGFKKDKEFKMSMYLKEIKL